jgi:opacity protein-like surface antigen
MNLKLAAVLCSGLLWSTAQGVFAQEVEPAPEQPQGTYPHPYTHPYGHDDAALRRKAEPYSRRHVYLGAEAVFIGLAHETGDIDVLPGVGGGFNITLGGRVHRRLALELNWLSTFQSHDERAAVFPGEDRPLTLNGITLDMRVYIRDRGRVQPYVTVGGGGYMLGPGYGRPDGSGPGFEAGGGVDIWMTRMLTLGFNAQYRGIGLYNVGPFDQDTYVSAVTLGADLRARF